MNEAQSSASLFEALMQQITNPRQKTSLERVKQACDYLSANGIKITAGAVESYCLDRGWEGPKAQSIRNSQGVLNRYVESSYNAQLWPKTKRHEPDQGPRISDASIQAYVSLLKDERDEAVRDKNRIVAAVRKIPAVKVDEVLNQGFSGAMEVSMPSSNDAPSGALRAAIRSLLDQAKLEACGLFLHRERIVHRSTGNVLLEKGELKILQNLVDAKAT